VDAVAKRFRTVSANLVRDLTDPDAGRDEIQAAVMAHPPRFIIHDGQTAWLDEVGLRGWFEAACAPADVPRWLERKPPLSRARDADVVRLSGGRGGARN